MTRPFSIWKECADVDKRTSNTEELAWDYELPWLDVCKDAGPYGRGPELLRKV